MRRQSEFRRLRDEFSLLNPLSGYVRYLFEINNVTKLARNELFYRSDNFLVNNVPFFVETGIKRIESIDYLSVYICCDDLRSRNYSVCCKVSLIRHNRSRKNYCKKFFHVYLKVKFL